VRVCGQKNFELVPLITPPTCQRILESNVIYMVLVDLRKRIQYRIFPFNVDWINKKDMFREYWLFVVIT
jgi:hypothetical protein